MEDKFTELCFWKVMEMLNDCKNLDEEFAIYRKLVEFGEEVIKELEEELCVEPIDTNWFPTDLDNYAGSMDNLAFCYMERKEYEKAIPLLERALQLYRIQEFYKPIFTYQRYYVLKKLVKCHKELGNKTMAILYEHEQRLLEATSETLKNDNKGSIEEGEL
jgi:tetratricopeptide (TPR) repeat protein